MTTRRITKLGGLVMIQRAILDAKEGPDLERAQEIRAARENARLSLLSHGLTMASVAMRLGAATSWSDYKAINERMRAGGYHRVRLTGGRSLDG